MMKNLYIYLQTKNVKKGPSMMKNIDKDEKWLKML